MSLKKPPKPLVETRPHVELEPNVAHNPEQGVPLGPPPRQYTPAVRDAIVANIRKGNRPQVAAAMAGIPSNTFYRWMQQGRDGAPHLYEFFEAVEQAVAICEGKAIEAVVGPAGDFSDLHGENAKWFLERRHADGYNPQAATKVNAMLEEFFKRLESGLPPVITQEMVGMSPFQLVIGAATGQMLTTGRQTFQLTNGSEEEDSD